MFLTGTLKFSILKIITAQGTFHSHADDAGSLLFEYATERV